MIRTFSEIRKFLREYLDGSVLTFVASALIALALWGRGIESRSATDGQNIQNSDKKIEKVESRLDHHDIEISNIRSGLSNIDGKLEVILQRLPSK